MIYPQCCLYAACIARQGRGSAQPLENDSHSSLELRPRTKIISRPYEFCRQVESLVSIIFIPAMEALVALSLASNVLQFVQFGSHIISETREIYRSSAGASAEHLNLEAVAQDLRRLLIPLQSSVQVGPELKKLLRACNGVAEDLLEAIQQLQTKDGPHRKWQSFQKAILSVWKKRKMSAFEKRMLFLRDQIQFHISTKSIFELK
jgi:hypothetical protein